MLKESKTNVYMATDTETIVFSSLMCVSYYPQIEKQFMFKLSRVCIMKEDNSVRTFIFFTILPMNNFPLQFE